MPAIVHNEKITKLDGSHHFYTQCWLPKGSSESVKAVFVIVHGAAEHSGRYQWLAEKLVAENFAVYALDHLGHGRTEGQRCHVTTITHYVEPLKQYIETEVKSRFPAVPLYVMGHSMGGLILGHFLLKYQQLVDAAVFSAPAVMTFGKPPFRYLMRALLTRIFFPRKPFLQLDATAVSRDAEVVAEYLQDPLVFNGKLSVSMALALSIAMEKLQKQASKITVPVCVMQGDADKLVNPNGAQYLFDQVSSNQKQLFVYSDLFHEIFNEPEKEQVFGDMISWIKALP